MQLRTGLTEAIILEVDGGLHVCQARLSLHLLSLIRSIMELFATIIVHRVWLRVERSIFVTYWLQSHMMIIELSHGVYVVVDKAWERLLGC